jgi:EAL domain-containing protein (putative c-di-GMP-specific phosphodiesterase class I)
VARPKSDQSFIRGIPHNQDDETLAKVMISLAISITCALSPRVSTRRSSSNSSRQMDATSTREGYYFSRSVTAEALFKEKFTGEPGLTYWTCYPALDEASGSVGPHSPPVDSTTISTNFFSESKVQ